MELILVVVISAGMAGNSQNCVSRSLKEIGTIKRFYSVYDVYYGLLHFIQPSVITKCGFIPEKRS